MKELGVISCQQSSSLIKKTHTSRKKSRAMLILLKFLLLGFRFFHITIKALLLNRRFVSPRLNLVKPLNLRQERRNITPKLPVTFVIRKLFPFYKILTLTISLPVKISQAFTRKDFSEITIKDEKNRSNPVTWLEENASQILHIKNTKSTNKIVRDNYQR